MSAEPTGEWDLGDLETRRPGPVVPMPAASHPDLRGQRVIVGLPGSGWRADLRADAAVVQGSRTYVPVLVEQEWYRAESEQVEVFAPQLDRARELVLGGDIAPVSG